MINKNKDYIWTYDSKMNDEEHGQFLDDDANNFIEACNLEVGMLIGDLRPELKGGIVNWTENDNIEAAADDYSDVEILNSQQDNLGLDKFEVLTDFREVVKDYADNIANGNDFKIEVKYNTDLGVYTMRSVIYNGSFMTKDLITTIDSDNNFKAVL